MARYEYKVVPAPTKGQKAKGVKTVQGRFAVSVESVLNNMGATGWEYLRAELLPSEERVGLTGSTTNWRNVLVFRRALDSDLDAFQPHVLDAPNAVAPAVVAAPSMVAQTPAEPPRLATGAERMLKDNGVEELSDVSGMTQALKARAGRQATADMDEGDEGEMPEDGRPTDSGIDDEMDGGLEVSEQSQKAAEAQALIRGMRDRD